MGAWRGHLVRPGLVARPYRAHARCVAAVIRDAQRSGLGRRLLPFAGKSLRLILPMLALILGTPALAVSEGAQQIVQNAVSLALIGTIGFILVQFVDAMAQLVLSRYSLDVTPAWRVVSTPRSWCSRK